MKLGVLEYDVTGPFYVLFSPSLLREQGHSGLMGPLIQSKAFVYVQRGPKGVVNRP